MGRIASNASVIGIIGDHQTSNSISASAIEILVFWHLLSVMSQAIYIYEGCQCEILAHRLHMTHLWPPGLC